MGILDFIVKSLTPLKKDESKEAKTKADKKNQKDSWEDSGYNKSIDSLKKRAAEMSSKIEGVYNPIDAAHRKRLVIEIFGDKGSISKSNYKKKLEELEKKRQKAKGYHERSKIEELIKFYKAFDKAV
jgi:membrane-bound lytic murein transglycosylase